MTQRNEFDHIKVDIKQDTPDNLRIQTRITPEEKPSNCEYSICPIA
jgi:hypothetical protein